MSSTTLPSSRAFVTRLLISLASEPTPPPPPPPPPTGVVPNHNLLQNLSHLSKRGQLLALQVLFPNEFLPALDLLDRQLVTRVAIVDASAASSIALGAPPAVPPEPSVGPVPPPEPHNDAPSPPSPSRSSTIPPNTIYHVQSAQTQRPSRYASSYDTTTFYEVRLLAWNCSCPAFAFAAFPQGGGVDSFSSDDDDDNNEHDDKNDGDNHLAENTGVNTTTTTPPTSSSSPSPPSLSNPPPTPTFLFGGLTTTTTNPTIPPVCKHLLACVLAEHCSPLFGAFVKHRQVSVDEAAAWAAGWGD